MSNSHRKDSSRRKFLSLGLLAAGSGLVATKATAQAVPESGKTVKMLTPDGKLVEVDQAIIDQAKVGKKASKKDIIEWIHPAK